MRPQHSIGAAESRLSPEAQSVASDGKGTRVISDTWEQQRSSAWHRTAGLEFDPRDHQSMVYDETRRAVLLFGGVAAAPAPRAPQPFLQDTWILERDRWRQLSAAGPPARYVHGMVFDERAGVVLLYSGAAAHKDAPLTDMWKWDGIRWSEVTLSGPTPGYRYQPVMVDDKRRGRSVLFGGLQGADRGTWEWDGTRWTEIPDPG